MVFRQIPPDKMKQVCNILKTFVTPIYFCYCFKAKIYQLCVLTIRKTYVYGIVGYISGFSGKAALLYFSAIDKGSCADPDSIISFCGTLSE